MRKLLLILFLFSFPAMALIVNPTTVVGKVKSFDDKIVTLHAEENAIVIPREYVPAEKIKANLEIEVNLTEDQFSKVKIEKIQK